MKSALVLGVDGGGTRTTAWVADAEGNVLSKGVGGPSNIQSVGAEAARTGLHSAIEQALAAANTENVASACYGLAGFDRPEDKKLLAEWTSHWSRNVTLVNDCDLVIAAGTAQGWGAGVIAGTGSIAVARTPDGRCSRAGGWGYLFGDEGSGYSVAVAGLRKLARRADGREPRPAVDPLTRELCRALNIPDASRLIAAIHGANFDRRRIASLACYVVAAAREDAEVSEHILLPAAHSLAETVAAAVRGIGWQSGPLPLAMAGGFLLNVPEVSRCMLARLGSLGYDVTATAVPAPARGAIVLAAKALQP
jgi:N-acetylglucosamine kinase-like BadF-type ATPase